MKIHSPRGAFFHDVRVVFKDTIRNMKQAQLPLVASSLAYTTILSLIPLLAVSFAIFKSFGGLKALQETIEPFILNNLAEGVSDEVIDKLGEFINNAHTSAIGIGGLVGLIFTSMSMLSNIETAINRVWHAPMTRTLFHRISAYWLLITLGPLAMAIVLGFVSSSRMPLSSLLPSGTGIFVITALGFSAVYKWVPHARVSTRCALIAGLLIAAVFNLAQYGFRMYTSHLISYSKIYGSLGAVPIILLWIYIVWLVVLSGAAFSSALEKHFELRKEARLKAGSAPPAAGG